MNFSKSQAESTSRSLKSSRLQQNSALGQPAIRQLQTTEDAFPDEDNSIKSTSNNPSSKGIDMENMAVGGDHSPIDLNGLDRHRGTDEFNPDYTNPSLFNGY